MLRLGYNAYKHTRAHAHLFCKKNYHSNEKIYYCPDKKNWRQKWLLISEESLSFFFVNFVKHFIQYSFGTFNTIHNEIILTAVLWWPDGGESAFLCNLTISVCNLHLNLHGMKGCTISYSCSLPCRPQTPLLPVNWHLWLLQSLASVKTFKNDGPLAPRLNHQPGGPGTTLCPPWWPYQHSSQGHWD